MAKPQNPLWQTTKTERKSYYSYFFGQNMIYNMIAGYLTTFLLLIGIDPIKSATVMLIVKVWDAVNDAIFGVIFDKIQFKSNKKYIPWLKIACALTPAATIAVFIIPTAASETVKLIWFALAYIIWDTAYTLCDVPAFGIITAMTSNVEERNTILSLKGITAGVGTALTTVLVSVLISEFIGLGYGPVSIVVAVVAMATMIPVCKHCQERNKTIDEEQFTVRRMLKYVISNKYLLIYYIGYIFYSGAQTYNALHMIMAYYIYENSLASLITGTVAALPQLIMALLVPKIIRKMDKTKLFRISAIATILLSFLILPTRENFILFVITFMLRSIPLGIIGVLSFTFTPVQNMVNIQQVQKQKVSHLLSRPLQLSSQQLSQVQWDLPFLAGLVSRHLTVLTVLKHLKQSTQELSRQAKQWMVFGSHITLYQLSVLLLLWLLHFYISIQV